MAKKRKMDEMELSAGATVGILNKFTAERSTKIARARKRLHPVRGKRVTNVESKVEKTVLKKQEDVDILCRKASHHTFDKARFIVLEYEKVTDEKRSSMGSRRRLVRASHDEDEGCQTANVGRHLPGRLPVLVELAHCLKREN